MKTLFLTILTFITIHVSAQYKYYKDSTYTQAFDFLLGGTSINNGQWWDDDEFTVPIGFTFHLFSDTVTQVVITGTGGIVTSTANPDNADYITGIIAHGSDLADRDITEVTSISPISYITSGVAPNRIFKIEWKNAGFFYAIDNGNYTDSINFQLWLYETKDYVEVHYGNGNYVSPNADLYDGGPGAWFGIFDSLDVNSPNFDCRIMYNLTGAQNSPTLDSAFSFPSLIPPGVTGNPVAGTVYRLSPKVTGGAAVGYDSYRTQVNFNIDYFNMQNEIRIDVFNNDNFQYILTDINGRIVDNGNMTKGRKILHTENLANGMYIVKLFSKTENTSFKFVK